MTRRSDRTDDAMVLGIDASRNRSGGAIRHLVGILSASDPRDFGIGHVHVWAYQKLLDQLPVADWWTGHCPAELDGSLPVQMLWQRRELPKEARAAGVDLMLNTDAGTVCRFRPSVTMSRDMLSYEPGEMARYGLSLKRLRLLALRWVQASSLRSGDGAIFLTRYAAEMIQRVSGPIENVAIVPHGVSPHFRAEPRKGLSRPIRCIYVSPADRYKHQWHVVRALASLRAEGYDLRLLLVGGAGDPVAQARLDVELDRSDPDRAFVEQVGFLPTEELPQVLAEHDLFIFASSCENMPNTLIEGMASGLPIACADRGPMPEVLGDAGVYFDPEKPTTIAAAVRSLVDDPGLRQRLAAEAFERAQDYSWARCARETWTFLRETHDRRRAAESRSGTDLTYR